MNVTPYVGVWIEMQNPQPVHYPKYVTPYVGVWIEIIYRFPDYAEW